MFFPVLICSFVQFPVFGCLAADNAKALEGLVGVAIYSATDSCTPCGTCGTVGVIQIDYRSCDRRQGLAED